MVLPGGSAASPPLQQCSVLLIPYLFLLWCLAITPTPPTAIEEDDISAEMNVHEILLLQGLGGRLEMNKGIWGLLRVFPRV